MDSERWQRIDRLFHAALEHDKSYRAAYLDRACAGDNTLRDEVESLLARAESGSFLETPALELAAKALARDQDSAASSRLTNSLTTSPAGSRYIEAGGFPRQAPENFRGTERFELLRRLGAGGFGVVYEAYDRENRSIVALKTLRRPMVDAVYGFKNEFRALAEIAHPNLISLYELFADSNHWFYTMELIDGVNFLNYVRAPSHTVDLERLRGAFIQLCEGVCAIHRAGKLHCDLKPSNVLVDNAGRVVILDFGLATDSEAIISAEDRLLAGTPQYLSPEQAGGLLPSPASDWYSVGVVLFEALTGQQPFHGSVREILEQKCRRNAPRPQDILTALPQELAEICWRLLTREPQDRPDGAEILRRMASEGKLCEAGPVLHASSHPPFIGRGNHLSILRETLQLAGSSQLVTVWVHGSSGIGKTALVERFLAEARASRDVVVFEGRCWERETVPYKALDGVVDNLARYLRRIPPTEAEALMPPNLAELARLFPALRDWGGLNQRALNEAKNSDPGSRRRGFVAFRQVLEHIGSRQPVIVFIDDLQWGDEDSANLLADLIRHSHKSGLLFVGCYRSEEAGTSPLLSRLLPLRASLGDRSVDLAVEALDGSEAMELAEALLANRTEERWVRNETKERPSSERLSACFGVFQHVHISSSRVAHAIANEARGNPFFIAELVRHKQVQQELSASDPAPSLEDLTNARLIRLPTATRRLLEIIALAGQPIDIRLAMRASAISGDGHAELNQLRAAHLLRMRKTDTREEAEAYHDRIREITEAGLAGEILKQRHYELALEWEASSKPDFRGLAFHFRRAGIVEKAIHYAVEAARQADSVLAYADALNFYQVALEALLELSATPERDERELKLRNLIIAKVTLAKGDAAPESIAATQCALNLAKRVGDPKQIVSPLINAGMRAYNAGHITNASAIADEVLGLAVAHKNDPLTLAAIEELQVGIRFSRGDLTGAERHFAAFLKLIEDPRFKPIPGLVAPTLGAASLNALLTGHVEIARQREAQMLAVGSPIGPYDAALAGYYGAKLHLFLQEYEQGETLATRALQIAEQYQLPMALEIARGVLGQARALLGHLSEGIELIRLAMAGVLENGAPGASLELAHRLGDALGRWGDIAEALENIERALQAPSLILGRPDVLTTRGELRLKEGSAELAEADFREAIGLAHDMGAKWFELLAALPLARLLASQSRCREAHTVLAKIYNSFTEGFDTPHLIKARRLLGDLSR